LPRGICADTNAGKEIIIIMADTTVTDPLLAPNPHRFVLFPIRYQAVWEMYKKHEVIDRIEFLCLFVLSNSRFDGFPD
jgi:hypothetical protein